jgi:hypothetical protein
MLSSLVSTTIVTTETTLSTLSTSITTYFLDAIVPKVSIVSSFGYDGTAGDSIPFSYDLDTGEILFSTANVCFKDIVSSIHQNASVFIDYNPVILLPMASSNSTLPRPISTYLVYDGNFLAATSYADTMSFNQYSGTAPLSNIYSKNLRLRIDPAFLLSNGESNYTIYHRMLSTATHVYNLGTSESSTLHIRTPQQNSLFVNIFNIS